MSDWPHFLGRRVDERAGSVNAPPFHREPICGNLHVDARPPLPFARSFEDGTIDRDVRDRSHRRTAASGKAEPANVHS